MSATDNQNVKKCPQTYRSYQLISLHSHMVAIIFNTVYIYNIYIIVVCMSLAALLFPALIILKCLKWDQIA